MLGNRMGPPPDEVSALITRYGHLARLLPDVDSFDPKDRVALAEARVVLNEMNKTLRAMNAFLKKPIHEC